MVLLDELEYGLEPHRIIRLLGSLGAKLPVAPLQVFMTTHSPAALAELSGDQVFVTRLAGTAHSVQPVGVSNICQGTIRIAPDAFLARSVIVCEGASEVGLIRGLDLHRVSDGLGSISAQGVALVDSDGGDPDRIVNRAAMLQGFGYRSAVLRDDDKRPAPAVEASFVAAGGPVFTWQDGRCLEQELFGSLAPTDVGALVQRAVEFVGEALVDDHIKSASAGSMDLEKILATCLSGQLTAEHRRVLGVAALSKPNWFKSVSRMEAVGRDVVGPGLANGALSLKGLVDSIFEWASRG
jgi:putative ATP-dependent endonuclease of OLD family